MSVCVACACNLAGTEPGTFCVKEDGSGVAAGQCTCKISVTGLLCDQCQAGFFGLDGADPDGCQCKCTVTGHLAC